MARLRSGSGSILTVVFALITGLAVGSNPSFQPLAWTRELFGRARPEVQAPAPAEATQKEASAQGKAAAVTPELDLLRRAEPSLFPDLFDSNARTPARVGALLGRHAALPALGDFSDLDAPDIDIPEQAEVTIYFRFFTENATGRALVERWLERRGRYRSFVDAALSLARLPRALEAVVLAESGYHPRALSPAGAVGLWQLMPETARAYGLAVEKGNDARRDPQSASDAAVRHLTMLRERLGSWELVLAAYNAGLSRIEDALRATGTKDYWALARTAGALPRETILYVPKVLALSLLLQNLDSFGFRDSGLLAQAPMPHTIGTPSLLTGPGSAGATRFAAQLSLSGDDEDGAGLLEPWLKKDSYAIVVAPPIGFSDASSARWGDGDVLDSASKETARVDEVLTLVGGPAATKPIEALYERSYRVMPGDTVSKIAATFGVQASQLVRHNRIDNPALLRVGQALRIPSRDMDGTAQKQQPLVTMYFASPGDTLSRIARSFGVSERDLILDNDLKNPSYVREGQILRVRVNRTHARSYMSHRLASDGDGGGEEP
jgi:membrane-bound lytic murein transglycosylase D